MRLQKVRQWLLANRTTVRLAFLLRLFAMAASSLMSLVWTRLLLRAMGDGPYGLFMSFQGVTRLGGLGDLGLSGALALQTGQIFGRQDQDKMRPFFEAARSLFLLMALILALAFLLLSPWLPQWLGFKSEAGAGLIQLLFATGGLGLLAFLLAGYFGSLNQGLGTVTWHILPLLLLSQVALATQWLLARAGHPLWVQNLSSVLISGGGTVLCFRAMLKLAHPWLGDLRPARVDFSQWRSLLVTSGWMYLYTLGGAVYSTTDRLLINAGFGAAAVPKYLLNYKLCELAVQLVLTATAVSAPKLNQWLASSEASDRTRLASEIRRLNIFQTLLGCTIAALYLALNDTFMRLWLGKDFLASQWWQFAFALNLAVTTSGDAGIQIAGICGRKGLRMAGLAIAFTGMLNLGLSFVSMKLGHIAGIAMATVLSQSILGLVLGWFTCRYLQIDFRPWCLRSWLLPVLFMVAVCWLRTLFPPDTVRNVAILITCSLVIITALALAIGFNLDLLRHEWAILRGFVSQRR